MHSLPANISFVSPSGSGLSQHSRPHWGQFVSCQFSLPGTGTFSLSGNVRYPPLSVVFLGSIFRGIFLHLHSPVGHLSYVCMGSSATHSLLYRYVCYNPHSGKFQSCHDKCIRCSNPDGRDAVLFLPFYFPIPFLPVLTYIF